MHEDLNQDVLALIPARGGSKSVPRKNLLLLHDKPMIAWAIEAAQKSEQINRILVTTDDPEIQQVALEYGAECPFLRPSSISGDLALDIEYHKHALDWLSDNEDYRPSFIANLRPTPPCRSSDLIDEAIKLFKSHPKADSLRSVQLADQTPFKMWGITDDGCLSQVSFLDDISEPYNMPRQQLPLIYWQNGYIDICRYSTVVGQSSTTGSKIIPFIINQPSADIDYPDQIEAASQQLYNFNVSGTSSPKTTSLRHPS